MRNRSNIIGHIRKKNGLKYYVKKIQRIGNGLSVYLTTEFNELNLNKGDEIFVYRVDDIIILSPYQLNMIHKNGVTTIAQDGKDLLKPIGIDDESWILFLGLLQLKKESERITDKDVVQGLNEALNLWIEEKRAIGGKFFWILKKKVDVEEIKKILNLEISNNIDKNI